MLARCCKVLHHCVLQVYNMREMGEELSKLLGRDEANSLGVQQVFVPFNGLHALQVGRSGGRPPAYAAPCNLPGAMPARWLARWLARGEAGMGMGGCQGAFHNQ